MMKIDEKGIDRSMIDHDYSLSLSLFLSWVTTYIPLNRVYDHTKRCQVGSDTHISVIAKISNKRIVSMLFLKNEKGNCIYIFHVFDDSFVKFLIYIDVYIWIKFKDPSVLIIRETQDDLEIIRKDRIESSVCTVFLYCSGFGLGYKNER